MNYVFTTDAENLAKFEYSNGAYKVAIANLDYTPPGKTAQKITVLFISVPGEVAAALFTAKAAYAKNEVRVRIDCSNLTKNAADAFYTAQLTRLELNV